MKSMDSWARPVKCLEEVPATFLKLFHEAAADQAVFPLTVYAPPDRWGRRKANPKLICLWDDRLAIIEKVGREIGKTVYCLPDITYLESGTMLLYSWLKIVGLTEKGMVTSTIEFNSVVEQFFRPLAEKMRLAMSRLNPGESVSIHEQEQQKFNIYQTVNYKFMNFAKRSLLKGESVVAQVLQPDIHVKYLRRFNRLVVGNHLTILTDREIILIKDAESLRSRNQTRYGGIWSYIPLHKIEDAALRTQLNTPDSRRKKAEAHLVGLQLNLKNGPQLELRFDPSQKESLEELMLRIKNRENPYPKCG